MLQVCRQNAVIIVEQGEGYVSNDKTQNYLNIELEITNLRFRAECKRRAKSYIGLQLKTVYEEVRRTKLIF